MGSSNICSVQFAQWFDGGLHSGLEVVCTVVWSPDAVGCLHRNRCLLGLWAVTLVTFANLITLVTLVTSVVLVTLVTLVTLANLITLITLVTSVNLVTKSVTLVNLKIISEL